MNSTSITIFIFQTLFKNILKFSKVLFDKVAKKSLLLNQLFILEDFLEEFAYNR